MTPKQFPFGCSITEIDTPESGPCWFVMCKEPAVNGEEGVARVHWSYVPKEKASSYTPTLLDAQIALCRIASEFYPAVFKTTWEPKVVEALGDDAERAIKAFNRRNTTCRR